MHSKILRSDQVLQHTLLIAEDFTFSTNDFYSLVEKALEEKQLPGIEISRVDHAEGGLLSSKRVYLRVIRERFVFDTCAAPFGSEFFFTSRSVYSPAVIRLWHIALVLGTFSLIFLPLYNYLGLFEAILSILVLMLGIAMVCRSAVQSEISDLDKFLLKIPGFGPIYEVFFRKETYYREDTRMLYLEIIPRMVENIFDEIAAQNGVKLHKYTRTPIFGSLYTRVSKS